MALASCPPSRGSSGVCAGCARFSQCREGGVTPESRSFLQPGLHLDPAPPARNRQGCGSEGEGGGGQWGWGTQAADALTTMQTVVAEAIAQGGDFVDPAAPATQIHRYRSAALIGMSQTRDRPGALMPSTTRSSLGG